jgi:hypothetical protein
MTAARTAGGRTAAAGGAGRLGNGLSAFGLADEPAGRHQAADVGAIAVRAVRLFTAEHQTLEVVVAIFTMVFIDGHTSSPLKQCQTPNLIDRLQKIKDLFQKTGGSIRGE